jgi:hypothetical protein
MMQTSLSQTTLQKERDELEQTVHNLTLQETKKKTIDGKEVHATRNRFYAFSPQAPAR